MGIFDWTILIFLLVCVVYGFRKGLAGALIQLAGLVLSFILIGQYYPAVRLGLMLKYNLNPILANLVALILIIVAILVVVKLVIYLLNSILKMMNLSFINQALGAVFGFVNGLIIIITISVLIDYIPAWSYKLEEPGKHRVYSAVQVIKDDLFEKFKLNARVKLQNLIQDKAHTEAQKALAPPSQK